MTQLGLVAAAAPWIVARDESLIASETEDLSLNTPVQYQVVQRTGFDPLQAHEHAEGGPRLGECLLTLQGAVAAEFPERFEYRIQPWRDAFGKSVNWTALEVKQDQNKFTGQVRIPAGGWYQLHICGHLRETNKRIDYRMQPLGVGEVFLIAGQSYAAGANDELLRVNEAGERVAAFDLATNTWRVAHDPQPAVGDGGTIWPALGDLLAPLLRTPVGFANAAAGGTSSRQWLPGEPLFENLVKTAKSVGAFRALLWQQGESDVIEKTSTQQYVDNLVTIRTAFEQQTGSKAIWLLAKSTLHPTVYNDPAGEQRIRTAIDQLVALPGFRPGPDTDTLGGENRGGPTTRRHFSGIGQRRAAQLWFAAIWQELMHPAETKVVG